jgi:glycosyltransferase involved in cell wall biosynthesis
MKIAHVGAFYKPVIGGVEKVIEELALRQIRDGHEVHVFCSDFDKEKTIELKEEVIDGVHVHRSKLWFKISTSGLIIPSLYKNLVFEHGKYGGNFDVVHSHVFGHLHFVQAAKFARKFNVKHIHTTHCPWTDSHRSLMGRIGIYLSYNTLSKKALREVNKIIAITPWELEFIKKYGGSDKQTRIITNGVGKEFFDTIEDNDFKEKNGIKGKLVLYLGRLNVTKGPDQFVEIAKIILKNRDDVTFVIRGPDEGMKSKVKELIGDEKRIILMDPTRDKQEIIKTYQAADVFVMPSFREGMPLTLMEAYACRLPVVATPVNGIPFELVNGKNGFLVDYGDNEYFANRIERLLDDHELRTRISKTNFEKAKDYDWDIIYKKYMEEYSSKD